MSHGLLLACAMLCAALLAAPAAMANAVAAGSDPQGDASDSSPGRDITAAALAYDRRTGTIRGGVALRGAPDAGARAFVTVMAGVWTAAGCDAYPQLALSSFTTESLARWTRFDAPGPPAAQGDAAKADAGELQTFEATDPALAGRPVDCIAAVLTDPADATVVYDIAGPFRFQPRPELAATLGRAPSSLKPGQTRTVRLTLHNPGDAPTGRLRLSVARQRGLTATAPKTVASLRPGQRRSVAVKVRLSSRARSATPLRITAVAGKLRVRQEATLYLRRPPQDDATSGSSVCAGYAPVFGGVGDIVTYPC